MSLTVGTPCPGPSLPGPSLTLLCESPPGAPCPVPSPRGRAPPGAAELVPRSHSQAGSPGAAEEWWRLPGQTESGQTGVCPLCPLGWLLQALPYPEHRREWVSVYLQYDHVCTVCMVIKCVCLEYVPPGWRAIPHRSHADEPPGLVTPTCHQEVRHCPEETCPKGNASLTHSLTHWSTVIYFRSCFTFVEKSLVLSCLIQGSPMLYLSKYFLNIHVISLTYLNKD